MRRLLLSLLAVLFLGVGCTPAVVPVVPVPPPGPQPDPTPTPTPTPVVEEIAPEAWDAVALGMTEAEVVAKVGASKHRGKVGPGYLALGYWTRFDGIARYVEVVFGPDGKVASKNRW